MREGVRTARETAAHAVWSWVRLQAARTLGWISTPV